MFSVQWHLTARCGNRCLHCYMFDGSRHEDEIRNELAWADKVRVLDSIAAFEDRYGGRVGRFVLTGGDPLASPDWRRLCLELSRRGKRTALLGNPETLTDTVIAQLADLGIEGFQISLDGLAEGHDRIRGRGRFAVALDRLEKLNQAKIPTWVMFTCFPSNSKSLIPLIRFLEQETGVTGFNFEIGCSQGNARTHLPGGFSPSELKRLLGEVAGEKKRMAARGGRMLIGEKSAFFKLVHYENERFHPVFAAGRSVADGCLAGWHGITLLGDGTVLPCRRLPIPVARLPEQTFEDAFLGADTMRRFRRRQSYTQCGDCDFYQWCRGCPALAQGMTGNPFGPSPVCFRQELPATHISAALGEEPDLAVSNSEEFRWVAQGLSIDSRQRLWTVPGPDWDRLVIDLAFDPQERKLFLKAPEVCLTRRGLATESPWAGDIMALFGPPDKDSGRMEKDLQGLGTRLLYRRLRDGVGETPDPGAGKTDRSARP